MPSEQVILIADGQAMTRMSIALLLRSFGFDTELVANGVDALEAVKKKSYAAILLDCNMVQMDGIHCAELIRKQETNTRTPIIALSIWDEPEVIQACLDAGMDAVLDKAFAPPLLEETIKTFVMPNSGVSLSA